MSASPRPSLRRPLFLFLALLVVAFGVGVLVDGLAQAKRPPATEPARREVTETYKCSFTVDTITSPGGEDCVWQRGDTFCADCPGDIGRRPCLTRPRPVAVSSTCTLNFKQDTSDSDGLCGRCQNSVNDGVRSGTELRPPGGNALAFDPISPVLASASAKLEVATLRKPRTPTEWAETVRTLLDIPEGHANLDPVLRQLAKVAKTQEEQGVRLSDMTFPDVLLLATADVALSGLDTKKWPSNLLDQVSVVHPDRDPDDGTPRLYGQVWRQMYARAATLESSDPKAAQRLARGALMFSAATSPTDNPVAIPNKAGGSRVVELARIADLDAWQSDELGKLADWSNDQAIEYGSKLPDPTNKWVWNLQDEVMRRAKDEAEPEKVAPLAVDEANVLAATKKVWRDTPADPYSVYNAANSTQGLVQYLACLGQKSLAAKVVEIAHGRANRYAADPQLQRIVRELEVPADPWKPFRKSNQRP